MKRGKEARKLTARIRQIEAVSGSSLTPHTVDVRELKHK
jgi:hypothetical protein